MFRLLALLLFCDLIGYIISQHEHRPDETANGRVHGEEHPHYPLNSPPTPGQIISQNYDAPNPNHFPVPFPPPGAPVLGHVYDPYANHVPAPSTPPVIDGSLLGWLKRSTTYGKPIEKLQESSSEFWKNLHDFAVQKARDAAAEKDGHGREHHEDHWPKLEKSFKQVLSDMNSIANAKYNTKQTFKHTNKAISDLRENPNDEHRKGEVRKSLGKDLHHEITALFSSPLHSLGRIYNLITGGDAASKDNQGEHHGSKEGHHDGYMGDKAGHPYEPYHDHGKDHQGHSGPPPFIYEGDHIHPDYNIQPKHGDHEGNEHHDKEGHFKENHTDHTNSGHHQAGVPPERSPVESIIDGFLYYFPIDKLIT